MKEIKIENYKNLESIKEFKENEFIINLENCKVHKRKEIIDFLVGLTFLRGSFKKINANKFEVIIVK